MRGRIAAPALAPTSHKNATRRRLALVLLALLMAFVVITALVGAHAGRGLDGRAVAWAQAHASAPLTTVARVLDVIGAWWVTAPLVIVLVLVLVLLSSRRHDALYLLLTMATAGALNLLLKMVFRRSPPGGVSGGIPARFYAFPSGHAMGAAALAAALTFIVWPTRWRWPMVALGVLYAIIMGVSRVVLAVHWPSDVAAGWALGAAVAIALRLLVSGSGGGVARPEATFGARPAGAPGRASGATASRTPRAETPIDVVFLDWGGTLMEDDGAHAGPMVLWPQVAALDGARETLDALCSSYRLVVATNADDSRSRDVLAALARVGLDIHIDDVVASREIGARKPDPFFYRAALLRAGRGGVPLAAEHAVMVGDSWPNDVAGAQAAGLRAIWFNPRKARRPGGAAAPDAEIRRLADLPAELARLGGDPSGRRHPAGPAPPATRRSIASRRDGT